MGSTLGEAVASGTGFAAIMVAVWAGVSVLRPDTSGIRGPWWSLWMPLAIWTGVSLGHVIRVPLGMWVVLIGVGLGIDGHPSMRTRAMGAGIVVVAAVWLTWLGGPSWERAAWAVAWLTAVSAAAVLRPGLTRNRVAAILAMAVLVSLPLSSQPVVAGTGTVVAGGWLALYLRFWLRQQQSWAERRYQAEHDALTGALSRWGLKAWQSRQLLTSLHGLVVAFDLDQFKWFNDTYGHLAGDRVLEQIATRLMLVLPPEAVLVRTGGDEFQVWAPHRTEGAQDALADQLFRVATADPFYVDGRRFRLGVSMGAASGPLGAKTAEAADRALMEAKRSGKNCLKIAGPNAPADVADRRDMPLHLGWLAGAADMLWAGWDRPAALLTRDGQLLYGNEGFTQHLASSVGRIVDNVLGSVENGSPARPPVWRGIVAWPRAPERITWAQETVVPVIVGQHAVGYWLMVEREDTDPKWAQYPAFLSHLKLNMVFQPVVDLATKKAVGYEALARPTLEGTHWEPGAMFQLARRAGHVVPLDFLCLRSLEETLRTISWPKTADLFVNVAAETAVDPGFVRLRQQWAGKWPAMHCVWELSERGNRDITGQAISGSDRSNAVWALDDFGNGDADIWRLFSYPWAWLKLDRSVISLLQTEPRISQWVSYLVTWAHEQGRRVIAEGVETVAEEDIVRALGVDAGQGFRWAAPEPWERAQIASWE